MRLSLLLIIMALATSASSQQPQNKPQQSQQSAATDQRGTRESPIVVKILPAAKTPEETAQENKDREQKAANDRYTIKLTGILAFIAFLQLLVFGYQAYKLRQTVESAGEQAQAMERHISQAERSAKAMEDVVAVINFGNHAALRAYLTVVIGAAIYQEHTDDIGDLKFQVKPLVVNTGSTPARKVCFRAAAEILPIPIPEDFKFPLPAVGTTDAGAVGARQQTTITATVNDFVPWEEVGDIKDGTKRALCAWGTIAYEDLFGGQHTTKFGQIVTWLRDGKTVFGYYIAGQNDAD